MERMTVEARDGRFVGVLQSLRAGVWKTVMVLPETAADLRHAAISATDTLAAQVGCRFVTGAPALGLAA